jgi:hypothetical protein
MAEAIAETKEHMVLELYRVLKVDLANRIKVKTSAGAIDHTNCLAVLTRVYLLLTVVIHICTIRRHHALQWTIK